MSKKKKDKKKDKKKKSIKNKKYQKMLKKSKLKSTVDKKAIKKARKALDKISDIPAVSEVRLDCNHNAKKPGRMTVVEFKQLGYSVLNSDVDQFVETFGAGNVMACGSCFEPLVPYEVVMKTPVTIENFSVVMRAMKNVIVSREDDRKDVRKINKAAMAAVGEMSTLNRKFQKVVKKIQKVEAKTGAVKGGNGNFARKADQNYSLED